MVDSDKSKKIAREWIKVGEFPFSQFSWIRGLTYESLDWRVWVAMFQIGSQSRLS